MCIRDSNDAVCELVVWYSSVCDGIGVCNDVDCDEIGVSNNVNCDEIVVCNSAVCVKIETCCDIEACVELETKSSSIEAVFIGIGLCVRKVRMLSEDAW